ncbi:MAG: DUF192 domain-containing protein [Bacteroidota bacterium]
MQVFKKALALTFLSSLLFLPFSCKEDTKKPPVKRQEVAFTKEGELRLYKKDSSLINTIAIEIADNDYETETGLMYRTSMKDTQGMLFVFETEELRYFYMKNTQIPLDIIYINAEKRIVSFAKNARPLDETSLPSNAPAKYVLEVNAGLADQWGLQTGDFVDFD